MQSFTVRWPCFVLFIFAACFPVRAKEPKVLSIGSEAPPLKIQHWITDGEGKYKPVEKFEAGKVYVIEFWATTCGPCVQSIPHLAELQQKYADQGLQVIGVSNEPLEDIQAFANTKAQDVSGKPTTIGALTKKYSLTTDPDGSTDLDYMMAAKQDSIPVAFIVGKDSRIEWFGHPMEMDDVLDEVIHGKWDRVKFKEEQDLFQEVQTTITKLMRQKKFGEAIAALDGFLKRTNEPRIQFVLLKAKIDMQVRSSQSANDSPAVFRTLLAICKDEPLFVQDVAWTAYEMFIQDQLKDRDTIELAIGAMKEALSLVKPDNTKANMLDTLAHLQYVGGALDEAIASETEAIELALPSQKAGFQEFMTELKAQKK